MIITQFNQHIRIEHRISLRNHMYFVEIEKKNFFGWRAAARAKEKPKFFFFQTYGMRLLIRRGIFTRSRCRANYFLYSIPVEMRGKKLFSKFDFRITL